MKKVFTGFGIGVALLVLGAALVILGYRWKGQRDLARTLAELSADGDDVEAPVPVPVIDEADSEVARVFLERCKRVLMARARVGVKGRGLALIPTLVHTSSVGTVVGWEVSDAALLFSGCGTPVPISGLAKPTWDDSLNASRQMDPEVTRLLGGAVPTRAWDGMFAEEEVLYAGKAMVEWFVPRAHAGDWTSAVAVMNWLTSVANSLARTREARRWDGTVDLRILRSVWREVGWALVEDPRVPDDVRAALARIPRPTFDRENLAQMFCVERARARARLRELTPAAASGSEGWPDSMSYARPVTWNTGNWHLQQVESSVNRQWISWRRTLWLLAGRDQYEARWLRATHEVVKGVRTFDVADWRDASLFRLGKAQEMRTSRDPYFAMMQRPQQLVRSFLIADAQSVLFLTANAIRRFERRHGRLPSALAELVPTYLDAELPDPISGGPLFYEPKEGGRFVLSSVRPDESHSWGPVDIIAPREVVTWSCAQRPAP